MWTSRIRLVSIFMIDPPFVVRCPRRSQFAFPRAKSIRSHSRDTNQTARKPTYRFLAFYHESVQLEKLADYRLSLLFN